MNIAARRYIERARNRDTYVSELENDFFKYRVEIAGQGYYMNTLDEVSAFLWGVMAEFASRLTRLILGVSRVMAGWADVPPAIFEIESI